MAAWIPCEECGQIAVRVDPADPPRRIYCAACQQKPMQRLEAHVWAELTDWLDGQGIEPSAALETLTDVWEGIFASEYLEQVAEGYMAKWL